MFSVSVCSVVQDRLSLTLIPFSSRDLHDASISIELTSISCLNQVQDNSHSALTVKLPAAMFMHGTHPFSCAESCTWILCDSHAVLFLLTQQEMERSLEKEQGWPLLHVGGCCTDGSFPSCRFAVMWALFSACLNLINSSVGCSISLITRVVPRLVWLYL